MTDEYQGWTLAEHPTIETFNLLDYNYGHIIQGMQKSGFHQWGFLVYRCTYRDDDIWARYVQHMNESITAKLDHYGQKYLLQKYLDLTIIDDRRGLEHASKHHVRSHFAEWALQHRPPDEGRRSIATFFARKILRFRYCLYVDQKCIDTFVKYEAWQRDGAQGLAPRVVCAVIDTNCRPEGEGKRGYEFVEGCTREFTGWMYTTVTFLPSLYNRLHHETLTEDYQSYERPPGVPNARGMRMPL